MKAARLIQAAYYRKKAYKKVRGIIHQEEVDKLKHQEYLQHQKDDKKMHIVGGLILISQRCDEECSTHANS